MMTIRTVIFDFDSTLWPEETLDQIMIRCLHDDPDKESKAQEIESICAGGMSGEISFTDSLMNRLQIASLSRSDIDLYVQEHADMMDDRIRDMIRDLQVKNKDIYIISGGFKEIIVPLLAPLGITEDRIFANSFAFDDLGNYRGVLPSPLNYGGGKVKILEAIHPTKEVLMLGDGMSDWHCWESGMLDRFIGCGFYQRREALAGVASEYIDDMDELVKVMQGL